MRALIEELCRDGRLAGSAGGSAARALIASRLRAQGHLVVEQALPSIGGANVLAMVPGTTDRWVVFGAHYDHLGEDFLGADDNAAGVAMLVELGASLARARPKGRGVVLAAFDAEEPPHFLSGTMGSQWFVEHPPVPMGQIDLMVCLDLVGHALGDARLPAEVRQTVFALGAEKSAGTASHLERLARLEAGVVVRRADAETIPPLSDYWAFWERKVPFVFFTCARWRHYHTREDTPEKLDYEKIAATARWLERFVRESCARNDERFEWVDVRDDASTLRTMVAIAEALGIGELRERAVALLGRCVGPRLPDDVRGQMLMLVGMLESGLA